ncbi:hypothetical protein BJ166DRAFT_607458 [Pestalotiopsis sp. NC0098]|nr:hypothetical protein BJ166DRAFT_607458 [Pestalotiopsis sp. NC0098]
MTSYPESQNSWATMGQLMGSQDPRDALLSSQFQDTQVDPDSLQLLPDQDDVAHDRSTNQDAPQHESPKLGQLIHRTHASVDDIGEGFQFTAFPAKPTEPSITTKRSATLPEGISAAIGPDTPADPTGIIRAPMSDSFLQNKPYRGPMVSFLTICPVNLAPAQKGPNLTQDRRPPILDLVVRGSRHSNHALKKTVRRSALSTTTNTAIVMNNSINRPTVILTMSTATGQFISRGTLTSSMSVVTKQFTIKSSRLDRTITLTHRSLLRSWHRSKLRRESTIRGKMQLPEGEMVTPFFLHCLPRLLIAAKSMATHQNPMHGQRRKKVIKCSRCIAERRR